MNYFKDCKTLEETKRRFKELVKKYHPDVNEQDTTDIMKEIIRQFEIASKSNNQTFSAEDAYNIVFSDVLIKIAHLDIDIEICGKWLWVTGQTYGCKDTLKAAGFRWASNKKAWYWHREEDKSSNRKKMTMEEIRKIHGSAKVNNEQKAKFLA